MFWQLVCSHLIADFPLQSERMARGKLRARVLLLHVSIHFVTLLMVTFPAGRQAWPALLALAAAHFGIDTAKNWFTRHRPGWVIWPYLIDQALHVLSLVLLAAWIETTWPSAAAALPRRAAVIAFGFLLVTFVWRITELIMGRRAPAGPGAPPAQSWARLGFRALLLAALLLGWSLLSGPGAGPAAAGATILLAYPNTRAGRRELAADLLLTTLVAVLVITIQEGAL